MFLILPMPEAMVTILNNAGGNLPSMEEMIAALSSPVVPKGAERIQKESELSTDDMIKEIFSMLKSSQGQQSQIVNPDTFI